MTTFAERLVNAENLPNGIGISEHANDPYTAIISTWDDKKINLGEIHETDCGNDVEIAAKMAGKMLEVYNRIAH